MTTTPQGSVPGQPATLQQSTTRDIPDVSRFIQFDCPKLSVKINTDEGVSLALLEIHRFEVGVALSRDCKDCGFTLQGVEITAADGSPADGGVKLLVTPLTDADDLVRIYFKEDCSR